mmetsp:Transcript_35588/g.88942  ORF Transcript_35588/g.88942 Transcript_35588/m.88942 type:complete len:240 (-) Transcript_35588:183-902(-)
MGGASVSPRWPSPIARHRGGGTPSGRRVCAARCGVGLEVSPPGVAASHRQRATRNAQRAPQLRHTVSRLGPHQLRPSAAICRLGRRAWVRAWRTCSGWPNGSAALRTRARRCGTTTGSQGRRQPTCGLRATERAAARRRIRGSSQPTGNTGLLVQVRQLGAAAGPRGRRQPTRDVHAARWAPDQRRAGGARPGWASSSGRQGPSGGGASGGEHWRRHVRAVKHRSGETRGQDERDPRPR